MTFSPLSFPPLRHPRLRGGLGWWFVGLAALLCLAVPRVYAQGADEDIEISPAPAAPAPVIDLYTMGPGDDLFSVFGHASLCVTDAQHPTGICYNYGTADFSKPVQLIWDFLQGTAKFWVSGADLPRMLKIYAYLDRTVYRQRLPLSPEEARRGAERLATDALPQNRYYLYHHFRDNCSTRPRDHLDAIVDGRLSAAAGEAYGDSIRGMVRTWTRGWWSLQVLDETLIGRVTDEPLTTWQAMFLPDVLRDHVTRTLGVQPEVIYLRQAPLKQGGQWSGRLILAGVAGLLGLAGLVAARTGRPWVRRLLLAGVAATLGGIAVILDFLALVSDVPELYLNELLLVLLPTDLALPALPGNALRRYAKARLVLLLPVMALRGAGVFVQPLVVPALMVALPLLGLWMLRPPASATHR